MAEIFEKEVEETVGYRLSPEECEAMKQDIRNFINKNQEVPRDDLRKFLLNLFVKERGENEQDVEECIEEVFNEIDEEEGGDDAQQKLDQIKQIVNNLKL